jgi:hypothetical protein
MKAKGKIPTNDRWKKKYKEPLAQETSELPELPEGWCWTILGQLTTLIRNGYSTAPHEKEGTAILRISAVRPLSVDLTDVRFLPLAAGREYEFFVLEAGDLLFTRYNGNPALVGVCGLVSEVPSPILHPDKLIRVQVVDPLVESSFIQVAANTGASRLYLDRRVRTTAGQSGISGGDLRTMPILPPSAEQRRIGQQVGRRGAVPTPGKLLDGSPTRRDPQRARAVRRTEELPECVGERRGVALRIEQALHPWTYHAGQRRHVDRHDRQRHRHVLENLEGRPVEVDLEVAVPARLERGDADRHPAEIGGHLGMAASRRIGSRLRGPARERAARSRSAPRRRRSSGKAGRGDLRAGALSPPRRASARRAKAESCRRSRPPGAPRVVGSPPAGRRGESDRCSRPTATARTREGSRPWG